LGKDCPVKGGKAEQWAVRETGEIPFGGKFVNHVRIGRRRSIS